MLFEHDVHGGLVVDADGGFVLAKVKRRDLKRRGLGLPDFHALRHGAAMDCEDAEEARDLLRHKNSNVTRAVYRAHFGDRRRELLRARLEARLEASDSGWGALCGTPGARRSYGFAGETRFGMTTHHGSPGSCKR